MPYDNLPTKDALSWILPGDFHTDIFKSWIHLKIAEPVILVISVLLLMGFKRFQRMSYKLDIRDDISKSNKPKELIKVTTALRIGVLYLNWLLMLN